MVRFPKTVYLLR